MGITDMTLRSWSVTPLLRQWTVQQNVKEQISRKEFFLSKGSNKVKTILACCSEPLRSAAQSHNSSDHCDDTLLTLLIPSFDTQVRHIFHFLLETSDWIPAKPPLLPFTSYATLTRLSHCSPHRIPAQDKSRQEQWHPYVDAPECGDVPADLRRPKCYSCCCRFSYWEICWLRPVARPIWTAAGPIWLSNLGEKLRRDSSPTKLQNVLGLVSSIVN